MKYLISGYGPGNSGVGRLMKVLVQEYGQKGYKIIYKREQVLSIKNLLKKARYRQALIEYFSRFYDNITFTLKVNFIKCSDIVFMHPQTVGFSILFKLVKKNNIFLYILDNSFFCISSYNTHPVKNTECLNCLYEIKPFNECRPAPVKISKKRNIKYLKKLQKISYKITFYAQNKMQLLLLKKHFGEKTIIKVVGMDTKETSKLKHKLIRPKKYNFDVVFHGSSLKSKGLSYVIKIAEYLPLYTFFIPDDFENVKRIINCDIPSNIFFRSMSWENGLYEEVRSAKIVINPSLWSAPIEGALIKSAACNFNVATVISKYGYEREIKSIKNHIRLNENPVLGSEQISRALMKIK